MTMKWIKKVYGLFVDDPLLAVLSLIALAIVFYWPILDYRGGPV